MQNYQEIEEMDSYEHEAEEQRLREEEKRLSIALQAFGGRLTQLAKDQVAAKSQIEERWLEDLRNVHGKYDDKTMNAIQKNKGSKVFVNITRHKCNTAEARMIDMLFPSDDKNWSISATPDPELSMLAKRGEGKQLEGQDAEIMAEVRARLDEANDKARAMERLIEDQLVEADYAAKCRDAIHDCVQLGTGIIKSPVIEGRINQRWETDESGMSVLTIEESLEPTVEVVSPWDYYPDMSARNKSEVGFEFERKFLNKKQVRNLLKLPNVLRDQVLEVLNDEEPGISENDRFGDLRTISGDSSNTTRERYEMWEYHGEIEEEELEAVGMELEEGEGMYGTVLILEGRVIRVSLNPLDTDASPYSVFNWDVDSNSLFGFGVPYLVRSPQDMVNAATRMMMDNAKLTVGSQIIYNSKLIEPTNGDYTLTPNKTWKVLEDGVDVRSAMQFIQVPSNQVDLGAIYTLSRTLIDEQSSLPAVATGEGDPNAAPQTATGASIQSGAAKVVFKRVIKNFDDDQTIPTIKKFYDYNMQYSDDPSVKGDMQVNAKGSTSLMVREQEAALMGQVLGMIDPAKIAMRIKDEEALTEFFKSRGISTSTLLRTDDEIAQIEERMAQAQQGQVNPEMIKLEMQRDIEAQKIQRIEIQMQLDAQRFQAEAQQKEQQMMMDYEIEMSKLAAQQQTTVEKLKLESGAVEMKSMLEQMKEQNRREIADMQISTQRQIAALKAQQESNKQSMQNMNLQAGYDTF